MERPTTAPALADGAIELRPWRLEDVPSLVAICNADDDMPRWLDRLPQPYTEQDARLYVAFSEKGWREAGDSLFAVVALDTGRVVGNIGVRWPDPDEGVADLGYWMGVEARGRGFTTRAVRLLAGWVLGDLGWERLEIRADPRNVASTRVAEKAGFTRDGVLRSIRTNVREGRRIDHAVYSLLRAEL